MRITSEYIKKHYKVTNQDSYHCNYIRIPTNYIEPTIDGMNEMNALIGWVLHKDIDELQRTPSKGVCNGPTGIGYSLIANRTGVELLYNCGFQFKVQFRHLKTNIKNKGKNRTGSQCFNEFKKLCTAYGIDLMKYYDPKNSALKKEIESPIRWLNEKYKDKTIEHVYHIDGHNMWFGQMIKVFPEFKQLVMDLYEERNTTKDENRKQDIKDLFTHTLGYCQSLDCKLKAGLAQLSKAGINGCNREVRKMMAFYGNRVIAVNTDGLWIKGIPNLNHLSDNIGEFGCDHENCTFRAISPNKYEFIEHGIYTAVVSGLTGLDHNKKRDLWKWGDIYNSSCKVYGFRWDTKYRRIKYEKCIE